MAKTIQVTLYYPTSNRSDKPFKNQFSSFKKILVRVNAAEINICHHPIYFQA